MSFSLDAERLQLALQGSDLVFWDVDQASGDVAVNPRGARARSRSAAALRRMGERRIFMATNCATSSSKRHAGHLWPAYTAAASACPPSPHRRSTRAVLLAIGVALLLELADRRVRSPEDAVAALGLPVIGTLPKPGAKRFLPGNRALLPGARGIALPAPLQEG